jgi:hypothetical protein
VFSLFDRGAMAGFLGAMAWGYGRRGYGAHRTARIALNDRFTSALRDLAAAAGDGARSAFRCLWERDRRPSLAWLGTSFGTKVLYFAADDDGRRPGGPLIYDANVMRGLHEVGEAGFASPSRLRADDYVQYVEVTQRTTDGIGDLRPDAAEYVLFGIGRAAREEESWARRASRLRGRSP